MAFPQIPTAGGTALTASQANTTATRTFPSLTGLTNNAGDLLIAICIVYQSSASAGAVFSGWTAGWTEFLDVGGTTSNMSIGAAYKFSSGSESGTPTVTQAATITGNAVMILMCIQGAHGTAAPEATGIANGTSAAADPAALTPSWGADDTLWIAVAGGGETSTTGSFTGVSSGTAPTNYSGTITMAITADAVGGCDGAVAFRQLNASSENVGTWSGIDLGQARNSALTIAVRPAAATNAPAGLASAAGAALQPTVVTAEDSPALELSSFGTFTGINPTDTINSVSVSVAGFSSDATMAVPTYQLWDGTTAQIGSTVSGNGRTDAGNVDVATFTGVSYSQLATLRVRIFAHNGTAAPGAVFSVDAAWLTVNYTPLNATSAPAGLATGTGTAQSPTVQTSGSTNAPAGLATGTGAAKTPTVAVTVNAGLATGTGAAQSPAVPATPGGQTATATATALQPSISASTAPAMPVVQADTLMLYTPQRIRPQVITSTVVPAGTAPAGAATGTGAAQSPAVSVTVNAGLATGTGAAQSPTPAVGANAQAATGAGTAQSPTVSTSSAANAPAQLATGAGAAQQPAVSVTVNAGLATGTGAAQSPAAGVGARPATAAGVAGALSTSIALTVNASAATGTAAAQQPAVQTAGSANAPAQLATGTGAAQQPAVSLTVNAQLATGAGAALQPAVSTAAFDNAPAQLAPAAGAAQQPSLAITVSAQLATGAATAQQPAVAVTVRASAATGTGAALNVPLIQFGHLAAAGLASAVGTARQPALAAGISPGLALAAAMALNPQVVVPIVYGLAKRAIVVGEHASPGGPQPTAHAEAVFVVEHATGG